MKYLILLLCMVWFLPMSVEAQVLPKIPSLFVQEDASLLSDTVTRKQANPRPFDYRVFPSEVDSKLQIILPTSENFTMRLVDEDGNVLLSHYQIFGENQLNLGHLKAARYFVELSCPKGKVVEPITKT